MRNSNIQSASPSQINHMQRLPLFPRRRLNFLENMLPEPDHIHLLQTRRHSEGNESAQLLPPKVQNSLSDEVEIGTQVRACVSHLG